MWKDIREEVWYVLVIWIILSWFIVLMNVQKIWESKETVLTNWEYSISGKDGFSGCAE